MPYLGSVQVMSSLTVRRRSYYGAVLGTIPTWQGRDERRLAIVT